MEGSMAKAAGGEKTIAKEASGKLGKAPRPPAAKNAKAPRTHRIAVLPGDGIGEEVVREGLKVLDAVAEIDGFLLERKIYPYGADHYLATKEAMPAAALAEMGECDAIYMGAIGDPRI